MEISITEFINDQIEELTQISRQTFTETFAEQNSAENLKKYLSDNLTALSLLKETKIPDSKFYLIAADGKTAGYLKLNFNDAQTEFKEREGLEIERIYIIKEFFGKGLGKLLLEKAVQTAKDHHKNYVWLGVWENNLRAIRFYENNGLKIFGAHDFVLGSDVQKDLLMKLILKTN